MDTVIAWPAQEVELDGGDMKALTISLKSTGGAFAAQLSQDQTADLALKMLDWLARATPDAETTRLRRPVMPIDVRFEPGRSEQSIVIAFDLGAAVARFEVQHAQLGEALGQLTLVPGAPKAN